MNTIEIRHSLNTDEETVVFVIVANLIAYKGHSDLFEALAYAKPAFPEKWQLWVVGDDRGILKSLKHLAETLDLTSHIQYLKSRNDVPNLLRSADIGLLVSHEEGFSNSILEGMAAGLPMIVTDVGGNKEAVVHLETGLVVPPKSPKKLAEALIRLANDKKLQKTMGHAGKKGVAETFSLKACVDLYEKLLLTLQ